MREPLWALLLSTLAGVIILSAITTIWRPFAGVTLPGTVPALIPTTAGVIWANIVARRGPLHVAIPAGIVLLISALTQGQGLVSLIPSESLVLLIAATSTGSNYGAHGLTAVFLLTISIGALAASFARQKAFRSESLERFRLAATRRSARGVTPNAEELAIEGRTPPPTRILVHITTGILGAALAGLACWWFGASRPEGVSDIEFAVPSRALLLLLLTGAIAALGAFSALAPGSAAIVTLLLFPLAPAVESVDSLATAIVVATALAYQGIAVPSFLIAATLAMSARASGTEAARNPSE
ncbi:MAG: hypothetical protein Q4G64_06340 [bacterium]|nr:hypothetical protein [bacterium]